MCGITGFLSFKNSVNLEEFYQAHLKIAHRGPDDEGFVYKEVGGNLKYLRGNDTVEGLEDRAHIKTVDTTSMILGHRRLSIIDLSTAGHQPYCYDELSLVYNGELYNYVELRNELIEEGYQFTTHTDTEVFLKGYACWKEEAFQKFNGMWAAAIYNKATDSLLLTRDRFGIKPLYYSLENDNLIFGSEVKFVSSFINDLRCNEDMVADYVEFGRLCHCNQTFFRGIYQLEPGCYGIFDTSTGLSIKKYYQRQQLQAPTVEEIQEMLNDSIKLRMRSDVTVGSLLSGGMDSSSIVCSIHKQKFAEHMQTFTIGYEEKAYDYEGQYVRDISEQTGFENNSVNLSPDPKLLEKLTYIIESPYRSFTEGAMYKIYDFIKEQTDVTVLLNGEGADEVFSGYNAHYGFYLLQLLRSGKVCTFRKEFRAIKARTGLSLRELLTQMAKSYAYDKNWDAVLCRSKIFNKKLGVKKARRSTNVFKNEVLSNREFSALPEYLRYADKISMNFSLEVRVPFLDYRLVDLASNMADEDYIRDGVTKYKLREAVKEVVPKSVYERKDKKGFFTPHDLWLKTTLYDDVKDEITRIREQGLFSFMNSEEVYKYYKKKGIDQKVWRIYCLSIWKRVWEVSG